MPPPTAHLPPPITIVTDILSHLSSVPPDLPSTPSRYPGDDGPSTKPYLLTLHALFPTTLLPALDLLDRRLVTQLELSDPPLPSSIVTTNDDANVHQPIYTDGNGRTAPAQHDTQIEQGIRPPPPPTTAPAASKPKPILTASLRKKKKKNNNNSRQINLKPPKIYYVRSSQPSSSSSSSTRFSSRSDRTPARAPQGGHQNEFDCKSYEVRTTAWSCSCAAFAFAAVNTPHSGHRYHGTALQENEEDEEKEEDGADDDMDVRRLGDGEDGYGHDKDEDGDEEDDDDHGGGGGQKEPYIDGSVGARLEWGGLMALYGRAPPPRRARRMDERAEEPYCAPLPLCKHLLACVLAEWWDEAAELVERRVVGRGEFAGWAAGWGG